MRSEGQGGLEDEEATLELNSDRCADVSETESRGQKPFKPEKLPALKPKAGSCWVCLGNSHEDSVVGSENGEGTQEEDGLGILF